jgi:hypothetical protein
MQALSLNLQVITTANFILDSRQFSMRYYASKFYFHHLGFPVPLYSFQFL